MRSGESGRGRRECWWVRCGRVGQVTWGLDRCKDFDFNSGCVEIIVSFEHKNGTMCLTC